MGQGWHLQWVLLVTSSLPYLILSYLNNKCFQALKVIAKLTISCVSTFDSNNDKCHWEKIMMLTPKLKYS